MTSTLLVRQLRLFLDDQEFLQCGGRIHNALVNEMTEFPYLLPSRHRFSRLVILDIHVTLHHLGTSATVTALCQVYWIPSTHQYVRSILHNCVSCLRVIGKSVFSTRSTSIAVLANTRCAPIHIYRGRLYGSIVREAS